MSYLRGLVMRTATALVTLGLLGGTVNAAPIGFSVDDETDSLYRVDLATGNSTLIGPVGFSDVEGLAYDASTMTLYGVDDALDALLKINTNTGMATAVAFGLFVSSDSGLAFGPDNNLYMANDNNSTGNTDFFRINPMTGAPTFLGSSSVSSVNGLGFIGSTLYGVSEVTDSLYTVNTSTGATTLVGALGQDLFEEVGVASFGNKLYAIDDGNEGAFTGIILEIDPGTAASTIIATHSFEFEGLAIVPEPAVLAGLCSLAFCGAVVGWRRRRRKA